MRTYPLRALVTALRSPVSMTKEAILTPHLGETHAAVSLSRACC